MAGEEKTMSNKIVYAFKRALWTFCESMIAFVTVGMPIWAIDWKMALGVSATSFVYSFLKSFGAGMPEEALDE